MTVPSPADKILPKMQSTRDDLLTLVESLDQGALTWRPPDGGWSIRDNLAHLADAERAHRRFVGAVLEGRSTYLEDFDLDRWNQEHVARRAGQSVDEILDALRAERQETLAFIAAIPAGVWDRQGDHPALGRVSVKQVVKVIGVHERMHLKEIRKLLGMQGVNDMPVTYTNRKGVTYYLCKSVTKTGKPRYYFAREPKGEAVEEIPEGFKVGESANGFVFLKKDRPAQILPEEVAAVEAAVERHPKSRNYRVSVKHDRIEVHEQVGPDAEDLVRALGQQGLGIPGMDDHIRAERERHARFTPVLRFILSNAGRRIFRVERMHYGGRNEWFEIRPSGPVDRLARQLIPTLGTDAFFELF